MVKIKVWGLVSVILIIIGFLQWFDSKEVKISNSALLVIIVIVIGFRDKLKKVFSKLDFSI